MASFFSFLCFVTVSVTYFSYFSLSTSEIVLPLSHSLSKIQFNHTHELLKSSSVRSTIRFHNHRHRHGHLHRRQVSLPLSPGSDYTFSFSLGDDPVQTISLYMDTGSDLVWFPCSPFECILCEGKYDTSVATTTPNVSSSALVTCNSPTCSAVHSSLPPSDLCAISHCPLGTIEISECSSACPSFYYAYADGSFIARLYHDSISIPMSSPSLQLKNFTFGCAHTALGEPIGVAGFGRGTLSLPAQLSNLSPHLGNSFSYCLISHSFDVRRIHRPSPLILGRYVKKRKQSVNGEEEEEEEFQYTPMLNNSKYTYFYCVGLEAISVGGSRIPTPERLKKVNRNGDGGMVVDSGTTFTMLPARLYEVVVAEFDRRVNRVYERARETEDRTGLGRCYYINDSVEKKVPKVAFHFGGNASVVLPTRNYFLGFTNGGNGVGRKRRVGCLMLMNGGDEAESGGPMATLGNYQQQGFEVMYDLEKGRVGFARKQCDTLWNSLNQGR